ncbi:MAG: 50S ribosomal protein L35 [Clostridia bacterium]|nr:50S ribosomal protein L35 [Clostridia bacterium]
MPKQKTHSSSKKRFKVTGTGKVLRTQAYKQHKLGNKSSKRKRNLRKTKVASPADQERIRQLIPYK